MPSNGFTVGRDLSLHIVRADGRPLEFNELTGFQAKKNSKTRTVTLLNGKNKPVPNRGGDWVGSFDIERSDSAVDDYFAELEAAYFAGLDETPVYITETITEPSGAVSQYRYTDVVLDLEDAGNWKGDDTVKLKVSFTASRRIKIS